MKMRFSVIVCTFNYAHLLPDALRTLASQTVSDFELLIVDDGSTDSTEEVVRKFSRQFRKCAHLKKPHTGLADSRNFGIQRASGTHIAFLDADDLWSPTYLESMQGVLERIPEAELVCCDGLRIYDTGEVYGSLFPANLPPVCGRLHSAKELFSFFPYVAPSSMMFKKSVYERTGPYRTDYPLGAAEDWEWVIRAAYQGAFCVRLDRKLVLYRFHGSNLISHADLMFEGWLSTYANRWGKTTDPEIRACGRQLTRRRFPALLARYSAQRNRQLLRLAIQSFDDDRLLKLAHFLTYFGLCSMARFTRQAKHAFGKLRRRPRQRLDLQASPEAIFAGLSGQRSKPEAVELTEPTE